MNNKFPLRMHCDPARGSAGSVTLGMEMFSRVVTASPCQWLFAGPENMVEHVVGELVNGALLGR